MQIEKQTNAPQFKSRCDFYSKQYTPFLWSLYVLLTECCLNAELTEILTGVNDDEQLKSQWCNGKTVDNQSNRPKLKSHADIQRKLYNELNSRKISLECHIEWMAEVKQKHLRIMSIPYWKWVKSFKIGSLEGNKKRLN